MSSVFNFLETHAWVIQALMIFFVVTIIHFFLNRIFSKLKVKFEERKSFGSLTITKSVQRPLVLLVWMLAATITLKLMVKTYATNLFFDVVQKGCNLFIVVVFAWLFMRVIRGVEYRYLKLPKKKRKVNVTTAQAMSQMARILVAIGAVLIAMPIIGAPISGVLAFSGFSTVAVAFAAKDLLANFFGSMMIYFDRPFEVGEWIKIPAQGIEGTVEFIDWRLTRIRTFDKRALYVPNSIFTTAVLENPSRMTNRRINAIISLRYSDADKLAVIVTDIKNMLVEHKDIDNDQTLMVNFVEFGDSSLNINMYTFTKTTVWAEFYEIRQDVFLKTLDIIKKHGAECAFPTRTVHVPDQVNVK